MTLRELIATLDAASHTGTYYDRAELDAMRDAAAAAERELTELRREGLVLGRQRP